MKTKLLRSAPLALVAIVGLFAAGLFASPQGLDAELDKLKSEDQVVRAETIQSLANSSANQMTLTLLDELRSDHDPLIKAGIVEIIKLRGVGTTHASELQGLFANSDAQVRQCAVVIAGTKPSLAASKLLRTAEDSEELITIRAAAAVAAGGIGAEARSRLRGLATDSDLHVTVRFAALRGLAATSSDGAKDVQKVAEDENEAIRARLAAVDALSSKDSKGVSILTNLAGSKWPAIQVRAIQGLVDHTVTASGATLATQLAHANANVRYAALRALIALNLETAHRLAIGGLLADADVRIQALAAESVGRSSRDRAQALQAGLRGLLASANFHVRYQAALALGSHGDNAGVATMRVDQNTPNVKQSLMANKALTLLGAAPK